MGSLWCAKRANVLSAVSFVVGMGLPKKSGSLGRTHTNLIRGCACVYEVERGRMGFSRRGAWTKAYCFKPDGARWPITSSVMFLVLGRVQREGGCVINAICGTEQNQYSQNGEVVTTHRC